MRPAEPLDLSWLASLELAFARRDAATILARRRHAGPLRVQKPLYPEDESVCHAIVLHPPAGIAGGDRLRIDCTPDAAAHALLTTPGAGKWYRANGLGAEQTVNLKVGAGWTAARSRTAARVRRRGRGRA
jgi:urease accessory protein